MNEQRPPTGEHERPVERFGKYELLQRIGVGGTAEVYRARARSIEGFEKILVVKKILPDHARDKLFVEMLVHEAKLCSALQHPNIVPIFDLGEIDGVHFIVMEHVEGCDLLKLLEECTRKTLPLPQALALFIVSEVAKGLDYAHKARDRRGRPLRIVHRDVSPANVMLSFEGAVKLTDFGVARAEAHVQPAESDAGPQSPQGLRGKLGYMSPEQLERGTTDHRSDIFALGTMLFEMMTMRRLFLGKSPLETKANVLAADIEPRLAKFSSLLPPAIQDMCRKALARDPAARYQSASALSDDIQDYLFEQRIRVRASDMAQFVRSMIASPPPLPAPKPAVAGDAVGELMQVLHPTTAPPSLDLARAMADPASPLLRIRNDDAEVFGPVSFDNLQRLIASGAVSDEEQVSSDGRSWVRVGQSELRRSAQPLFRDVGAPLYEGPLSPAYLPRLFYQLAISDATGMLKLSRDWMRKEIFYRQGTVVHIQSNIKSELLARFIVQQQVLDEALVERALMHATAQGLPLGEALVALGLLEPATLAALLAQQLEHRFVEVFSAKSGRFAYFDQSERPPTLLRDGIDVFPLLGPALRRHYDLETLRDIFASYGEAELEALPHTSLLPLEALHLEQHELDIAGLASTGKRISELVEEVGNAQEETLLRVLFLLVQTDHVRIRVTSEDDGSL